MPQLFISYSRVDTETTERLVERLRRVYGLPNVWYDDELHGGMRWWQAILNQIAQCDVFIYLLSNELVTSPYCQAEFTEAKRLQKPIVTVQIRDRTRLSDDLSEIQYVDMKRGLNDDTLARLIRAINEQAQVSKKKRALWRPITPLPNIPSSEEASSVARTDVETPTLEVQALPAPIGDRTVARATILGAVITGALGIAAVVVSAILPSLINPTPPVVPSHTATSDLTAAVVIPTETIPSQTIIPPTFTLAPTDTPQSPTEYSTETQTPTPTSTLHPTNAPTPTPTQTDSTSTITFTPTPTTPITSDTASSNHIFEAFANGELHLAYIPNMFTDSCHLSPNERYFAAGGDGVYITENLEKLYDLNGSGILQFSPDSTYVAVGGDGVYRIADGQRVFAISGDRNFSPMFSPDSTYVAVGGDGVYRIADGQLVLALSGTFSPDSAYLAVGGDGVYRVADGQLVLAISGDDNSSPVFTPDSTYVAVGGDGVYRLADGQRVFALSGAFSLDSTYVAVGGDGVYRLADGQRVFAIFGDDNSSPVFSPDSTYVAVSRDGVYRLADGQGVFGIWGSSPVFSPDSAYVATSWSVFRVANGTRIVDTVGLPNLSIQTDDMLGFGCVIFHRRLDRWGTTANTASVLAGTYIYDEPDSTSTIVKIVPRDAFLLLGDLSQDDNWYRVINFNDNWIERRFVYARWQSQPR